MGVLRATITGVLTGIVIDNVLGIHSDGEPTSSQCDDLAAAVLDAWGADVMPALSDQYSVSRCDVISLVDLAYGGYSHTYIGGEGAGPLLPTLICAKVNWHTAARGRSFRGRTGLAGIAESMTPPTSPNQLTDATQAAISTAVNNFLVDVNATMTAVLAGTTLAVVSTIGGGVVRPTPTATPITSVSVPLGIGTRRSRLT